MVVPVLRWIEELPDRSLRGFLLLVIVVLFALDWNLAMRVKQLETDMAVMRVKLEVQR